MKTNKVAEQAKKQAASIDKFIKSIIEANEYFGAGLIMQRLLKQTDESSLEDVVFELKIAANVETIKIKSLAAQIRFDEFNASIEENPYQLKAI